MELPAEMAKMNSAQAVWLSWREWLLKSNHQSLVIGVITAILIISVTTRVLSGSHTTIEAISKQKIPAAPSYWFPFLGHAPWMAFDKDSYLAGQREKYPEGIFSLTMLGRKHHFIYKPSLVTSLLNLQRPASEEQMLANRLLESAFGVGKKDQAVYSKIFPEAIAQYQHLLTEPGLSEITQTTLWNVKQNIADLVSFNSNPTDQTDWERMADADVVENTGGRGGTFVEANLMELTRNFVAKTVTPAIFGTDFVQNFDEIWKWLWMFDESFVLLAANATSWLPSPRIQRGKLARRRILAMMFEFHEALDKYLDGEDPGVRWQDLHNVSKLVRGRAELFKKNSISLQGRASFDLALLWATNANSNQLIPWMLFETYRDPIFLEEVREEISPYIQAIQPHNSFGPSVWIPPRLEEVDIDGLITKCPLLKAAYMETLRVYTGGWTIKFMHDDTLLEENGKGGNSFLLRKGTYAHIHHDMHQLDPQYFPNPKDWQTERHIKEGLDDEGRATKSVDMDTLRPYSGGATMCKGRQFALREMLLYAAVIITFYDMQPSKGGSWVTPETVKVVSSRRPRKPLMVWIKRRQLPNEKSRGDDKRKE